MPSWIIYYIIYLKNDSRILEDLEAIETVIVRLGLARPIRPGTLSWDQGDQNALEKNCPIFRKSSQNAEMITSKLNLKVDNIYIKPQNIYNRSCFQDKTDNYFSSKKYPKSSPFWVIFIPKSCPILEIFAQSGHTAWDKHYWLFVRATMTEKFNKIDLRGPML